MPIHDWSRVSAGTFHDFHQGWTIEIRNRLNSGVLPDGYYAMADQHSQRTGAGHRRPPVAAPNPRVGWSSRKLLLVSSGPPGRNGDGPVRSKSQPHRDSP